MTEPTFEEKKGVVCPFCGDDDFDNEGLMYHFTSNYCIIFERDYVKKSAFVELEEARKNEMFSLDNHYISKEKVRDALTTKVPFNGNVLTLTQGKYISNEKLREMGL